uniref:Uncharacterized protein n=1 Tax=Acrobeloides nanus TaxID=290746 RepID=A0A914DY05_9BILA
MSSSLMIGPTLFAARDHMLINMRGCFYHLDSALAQLNAISNQPTIQITAITSLSENTGQLTIMPYEFFKL